MKTLLERYKEGLHNYCQHKDPQAPVEPTWIKRMVEWENKIICFRTYNENEYCIDLIFQRDPHNPCKTDYASIGDESQQHRPQDIHPYWFNNKKFEFYFEPGNLTDEQIIQKTKTYIGLTNLPSFDKTKYTDDELYKKVKKLLTFS